MPAEFMAAFQDPEVGRCLGLKMLELVARDLQGWLSAGLDVKRIAINASNLELKVDDYSDRVMSVLRSRGIDFSHFEIEVTETVAFGDDSLSIGRNLSALATHGISLALDDFGTGFASLTHLKSLPISRVKIDQSFIRNIVNDQQSYSIVDAIVRLCHSLGKSVVAEGIEDQMQLEAIGGLRCDVAQGYFFARPMPAGAVGPFMLRHLAGLAANGPPLKGIRPQQPAMIPPLKLVGK
jgi:EAL domain-containing protein (putative c-di-GMP-specific phosphodiesterase class I)